LFSHCNDYSLLAAFPFLQISSDPSFGTYDNLAITPKLEKNIAEYGVYANCWY
jgi:hypothetical protein